ncbi:hypothetical protein OCK74_08815 [Chitinophagaceae bacterium LB-8]|uniref:Uncharacterized protein n=1 Tax=Paraflavisolibacter caeni TaxID=2982496 RepID=A0A9X3B7H7_9BACT|nr:hypothetical protein [Paraflavisolibacter caeni]MCU7549215.1 hypothetical protein [Paraflavisolibacter caeni]
MSTFYYDLELSQAKETAFAQKLQNQGFTVSTTQDMGRFNGYDVKAIHSTGTTTYEVKYDEMSSVTGNVAVEVCKMVNGEKVESGITASVANDYVYCFPGDNNFYNIPRFQLWKMIITQQYTKVVNSGDGGKYKLALFDKEYFVSRCTRI